MAVIDAGRFNVAAADDADDAKWFDIVFGADGIMLKRGDIEITASDLAFDHDEMVTDALNIVDDL